MTHAILAVCAALLFSSCAAISNGTVTAGVSGEQNGVDYHAEVTIPLKAATDGKATHNVQP